MTFSPRCFFLLLSVIFLFSGFGKRAFGVDVPPGDVRDASHAAMMAESVSYLQKAISHFESEPDSQSVAVRVAPIVTVTSGLLDAGVSPDETLLQSSLGFLRRFYDDRNSPGRHAAVSENLLTKIEACLDKADQIARKNAAHDLDARQNTPVDTAFLLNSLAPLDDADAVSQAMGFVQQLSDTGANGDETTVEIAAEIVLIDETPFVISPGLGGSIRFRDLHQVLAEQTTRPQVDAFSPLQCDCLIAAVHGLPGFPPPRDAPRLPGRESLFAAVPQPGRANDHRKKTDAERFSAYASDFYRSFLNAFEPQQSVTRRYLLADNLAALQTIRRLE